MTKVLPKKNELYKCLFGYNLNKEEKMDQLNLICI